MAKNGLKKGLEACFNRYTQEVGEIARQIFEERIKPFCIKRNWKFMPGMGSFWIGPKDGPAYYAEDHPDDEEFQEISALLQMEVEGFPVNNFGSLMRDHR